MRQFGLLHDLRALLMYHRDSGIGHYPNCEEISRFFHAHVDMPAGSSLQGIHRRQAVEATPDRAATAVDGDDCRKPPVTLVDIAEEVAQCRACSLAETRLTTRAGLGAGRVRLVIVGDWLTGDPAVSFPEDLQFGIEEDRMLFRMLAAINVPAEQAFITNAIKCVVPGTTQPQAENMQICLSYLHRQISLLMPECICAMGMMATRLLLGLPQPLSQLRGRFHSFQLDGGRQIPLIATYPPSFLLQNPEMKKAAWLDLQSVGRLLKSLP